MTATIDGERLRRLGRGEPIDALGQQAHRLAEVSELRAALTAVGEMGLERLSLALVERV